MAGPGASYLGDEEKKEVMEVLDSRYFFRYGAENDPNFKKKVLTVEKMVCDNFKVNHSVATNSGTSALIAALAAIGVGPGDEVIVPGYTYVASYSSIVFSGAVPVLAEIDQSMTISPADIEKKSLPKRKLSCLFICWETAATWMP